MYVHSQLKNMRISTFITAETFPPADPPEFLQWFRGPQDDICDADELLFHYQSFLFGLMQTATEHIEDICHECRYSFT